MYEHFYGLKEKPFALTPDPAFLYLGPKHLSGLSMLQYGLMNKVGITVLTGGIGTGKTTLIRQVLSDIDETTTIGLISNTHESFGNLLQWVAVAFGFNARAKNKAALYDLFANFLIEQYAKNRRTVLIVDEAQNLDNKTLEELRLLTNINADKDQILQLVLVGQPELRDRLRSEGLVQFVQRIGADFHLAPLTADETDAYIAHRVAVAGGRAELFEPLASRFIHYQCAGVPRLINSVCDTALVYGFASSESSISVQLVYSMVIERITAGLFAAAGAVSAATNPEQAARIAEENFKRAREDLRSGPSRNGRAEILQA